MLIVIRPIKLIISQFFFIFGKFFKISLYVNGIKISHTDNHLNTFKDKGGISNKVANFPTIKLPAQNNTERDNNK